jgi:DnaJ domain
MDRRLVLEVMIALDATPQRIQQLQVMPFQQAVRALEALKVHARARYKKLAFQWHPDRNQGDSGAEERFKVLGAVLSDLEKLQLRPPPPRPVVRFVHFPNMSPFGSSVSYTMSTNTSTTTTTYNATRVAFIKV